MGAEKVVESGRKCDGVLCCVVFVRFLFRKILKLELLSGVNAVFEVELSVMFPSYCRYFLSLFGRQESRESGRKYEVLWSLFS